MKWCWDRYTADYYDASPPSNPPAAPKPDPAVFAVGGAGGTRPTGAGSPRV